MKKFIILVMMSVIVLVLTSCDKILETAFKRQINQTRSEMLTDGNLHVVLVGSGGPMPNTERFPASVAVMAGGEFILVDTGGGAARNAMLQNLPLSGLSAVFLTHFHSDHIADLGEVNMNSWVMGRKQRLEVYGPEGVEKVVAGFTLAYELDSNYHTAHHGEGVAPTEARNPIARRVSTSAPDQSQLFFDRNGLKAYVFQLDHFPANPAVGYRFEYKGKVVVISGDTKKVDNLVKYAKNADIFICEALDDKTINFASRVAAEVNRSAISKILSDIPDYHMTPVEAAQVAQEAGVKKLVFYHIVPPVTNFLLKRRYMDGVDDVFDGDIELGEDGMTFVLE